MKAMLLESKLSEWPTHYDEKICMSAGEHRDIHGHADRVWLVETNTEVSLATQQQQNEHTNVHQTNSRCERGKQWT